MPQKKRTSTSKKTTRKAEHTNGESEAQLIPSTVLMPGPRKKRKGPSVRLSNHKARSVWFQTRATWPVREAPVRTLVRERTRAQRSLAVPTNITSNWECVGPTNIGG